MNRIRLILFSTVILTLSGRSCLAQTPTIAGEWQLAYYNDTVHYPEHHKRAVPDSHVKLTFGDSTFGGTFFCNGIGGKYEIRDSNRISINIGISTAVFCPGETQLERDIENTTHYTITHDSLTFFFGTDKLIFVHP